MLVVSYLAVRKWGSPASVWVVALAGLVLFALRIALVLVRAAAMERLGLPGAPEEWMIRFVASSPFAHTGLGSYGLAVAGYLLAMGFGCWLAARRASDATAAASTGTHLSASC